MSRRSTKLLKAALAEVHYSGAESLFAPFTQGVGVIYMLHQVLPDPPRAFEPSRVLRVTPDFLARVIQSTRDAGFDIVSLDALPGRLHDGGDRPFAVFTLDDGYKTIATSPIPFSSATRFPSRSTWRAISPMTSRIFGGLRSKTSCARHRI